MSTGIGFDVLRFPGEPIAMLLVVADHPVRATCLDDGRAIPLDTGIGTFAVADGATHSRLRLQVGDVYRDCTVRWPEPQPEPKGKRKRMRKENARGRGE
jgi:hypothetical protein